MLRSLDHYNIETAGLDATVAFYRDCLGMTLGERPALPVPGAWLCIDGRAVVHVNAVGGRGGPTGAIGHVAFEATGFEEISARLTRHAVPFRVVDSRPRLPLRQIYVEDPNGIAVELNVRDEPAEEG